MEGEEADKGMVDEAGDGEELGEAVERGGRAAVEDLVPRNPRWLLLP